MSDLLWPLRIYQSIPSHWRGQLGSALESGGVLHLRTPGVIHGRPEIGYYVQDIGAARALALRERVEGLWDIPGLEFLAPEQANVHIIAGDWKGPKRSVVWALDSLPPEVLPIMDAFHRLVLDAYAGPREVLAGEGRWSARDFSARESLRLEFTLRNKGSQSISLENPMSQHQDGSRLYLLVSHIGKDGPASSAQRVGIYPSSMSCLDSPAPHGERLQIPPGRAVRFSATPSAYLSPGEHQAVLLLDTGDAPDSPGDHVDGTLAVELPPLRIVHR